MLQRDIPVLDSPSASVYWGFATIGRSGGLPLVTQGAVGATQMLPASPRSQTASSLELPVKLCLLALSRFSDQFFTLDHLLLPSPSLLLCQLLYGYWA